MFARIMVAIGALATLGLAGTGLHGVAGVADRAGLERHILFGLAALLLFVLAHAWSLFYLAGLARVLREAAAAAGRPDALDPRLAAGGWPALIPGVLAIAGAVAVFLLGAALYGAGTGGRYHGALLWPVLALAAWAAVAEWRAVTATERSLAALEATGERPSA